MVGGTAVDAAVVGAAAACSASAASITLLKIGPAIVAPEELVD